MRVGRGIAGAHMHVAKIAKMRTRAWRMQTGTGRVVRPPRAQAQARERERTDACVRNHAGETRSRDIAAGER